MNVRELNETQLRELKEALLCELFDNVSWGELAEAETLISNKVVYKRYEGIEFTEDDFFSTEADAEEEVI